MSSKLVLVLAGALLATAQVCHGVAEGTVNGDDFADIVSRIDEKEARAFFSAYAGAGSSYTFPIVGDLAELTPENLWIKVGGEKIPVEKDHMIAFYRVLLAAHLTLKAGDETVEYVPGEKAAEEKGAERGVKQAKAPPPTKAKSPTYRLSCKYGSGLTYGDVVISAAEDADKIYRDLDVDGVVDALSFKGFPYSQDGDARKLFRKNQKKMEGLMSSPRGREKVLGTYAYYDVKDEGWKKDLLEELVEYYNLGTLAKE
jgi:hypothetical protein